MSLPTIGFVSLGCPKALVDSERIMTELRGGGYALSDSYAGADLVVVNTCGFIDDAKRESLDAIGEALAENGKVIVTGCLGAQASEILEHHPQVLAVTGPHAYAEVVTAVQRHLPPPPPRAHDPYVDLLPPQGLRLTPPHYAYLKISEGCNHRCSFCIIPSMRGDLVSRPIGDVLTEAEALVDAGVRELLVISQDTSAYGVDVKYRTGFHGGRPLKGDLVTLARELGQLDAWVRLHYVYPYPHVDALIPLMADGLVLPYLDVPLQHASPAILKAMRRPAAVENTLERIHGWRAVCPDLTVRSTFIVGFPGETEADFEALLAFLDQAQLDRVGCFPYSPVAGAAANALPGAVPEAVKQERLARFMERQAAISARRLQDKIGRTLEVLVDQIGDDGAIARSYADAPEIDGVVYLSDAEGVAVGDVLLVDVEDADAHDLYAVPSLV
ncbi:MAG TPA: 30S ribosomal protein S12 methylthiotransferase RimO [Gammaproteobacteria bacterium]|uniref:30S ribosomal protein S12 methylthiotransferase RimO n=1 Tax=Immundisolibacter sp. TaxID=1934948 RepID=UPI000E9505A5|nr:30S ribosomal protein S12 methylthiotransferase RimO [Gammaproteobacteria bacterium]HCZ48093.1 30S ribosomal protein S12 methylthiotransferase RimO [Gammaproteobacteria bacterium]MCH77531.1 30S ribosomal protein S12 methylthiotransferase RimO [Gammaproteobacteria bacterium]